MGGPNSNTLLLKKKKREREARFVVREEIARDSVFCWRAFLKLRVLKVCEQDGWQPVLHAGLRIVSAPDLKPDTDTENAPRHPARERTGKPS